MMKKKEKVDGIISSSSDNATNSGPPAAPISKAAKRKLQKKRARAAAKALHEASVLERAEAKAARVAAAAAAAAAAAEAQHPPPEPLAFAADENDHCETAPEAYVHIEGLLRLTAAALGIEPREMRIYDPYFCNGAVVRHLGALGFAHVYNRNEDFYARLESGDLPPHDVVVTNPPYSGAHPERMLHFLAQNGKPWLALMPNWVHTKEYYPAANSPVGRTIYLVPRKRYNYWTPRGRRADVATGGAKKGTHGHTNAALGIRTSPFISFWHAGHLPAEVVQRATPPDATCQLCYRTDALPPYIRP